MKKRISVENDGFVELIDHMGDDTRIVEAARVSYKGSRPKRDDERLIHYLMDNGHMSPFEHVEFEFYIRAPIFVARQWFRHRTGQPNEVSRRYRAFDGGLWRPSSWFKQSKKNKQASAGLLADEAAAEATRALDKAYRAAQDAYARLLDLGVSREQARAVLPLGSYTEFYWKQNLRNLLNLLDQRLSPHAQTETRAYAAAVLALIKPVVPVAMAAWEKARGF